MSKEGEGGYRRSVEDTMKEGCWRHPELNRAAELWLEMWGRKIDVRVSNPACACNLKSSTRTDKSEEALQERGGHPAVLAFLRETKVGQMVGLAACWENVLSTVSLLFLSSGHGQSGRHFCSDHDPRERT